MSIPTILTTTNSTPQINKAPFPFPISQKKKHTTTTAILTEYEKYKLGCLHFQHPVVAPEP